MRFLIEFEEDFYVQSGDPTALLTQSNPAARLAWQWTVRPAKVNGKATGKIAMVEISKKTKLVSKSKLPRVVEMLAGKYGSRIVGITSKDATTVCAQVQIYGVI